MLFRSEVPIPQWAVYPTTVRHPNRAGKSQDQQIGPILENESDSLRTNVSTLLLSYTDFDAFTSNQWDANTDQNAYGSLEDVHNEIHDKIGGNGGHMGALEVAAFDAAFWLHHGNVDRLYAIWQALHPSSFITAQPAPISTFGVEAGTQQTAASDLTPFWDASGRRFWTPAQLKDTAVFGYAYPETQSWQYADPSQYQDALRQAVATLYGSNVFSAFAGAQDQAVPAQAATSPQKVVSRGAQGAILSRAVARTADEKQPTKQDVAPRPAATPTPTHPAGPIPASLAHLAPDSTYTEWFVNVRAQKHGLGESFRLLVFLGAVPADPQAWQLAPDVVGRVSVLGRRRTTPCAKCRRDGAGELMVSGTVPLTTALLRRHVGGRGPQSLDAEHVVPYLRGQLAWRVSLFADGLEKDALDVPGLKVSVVSTQVRIGADGLPVHSGQYEVHPEVTAGMPGGLNPGEEVESR